MRNMKRRVAAGRSRPPWVRRARPRSRLRGVRRIRGPRAPRAAPTVSAGSRASAGPTASTRPASTSRTRSRSTRISCSADPRRLQPRRRRRRGRAGAGSRDCRAQADERRQDVDVPAQERRQVRSAGEPRDHLAGRQVRARASGADPKNGAQYAFYFNVIKGFDGVRARARRSRSPASGRRTRRRSSSTSRSPAGDFLLRLGMPAACPMPARGRRSASRASRVRTVATSSRPGPYMIEGSDNLDISSCKRDEADQRLRRQDEAHARPQPELQREDGQPQGSREQPGPLRVHRRHQPRRHLQQDRVRASSRTSTRRRRRRCSASTRRTRASGSTSTRTPRDGTYYITMNLTQPPFDDVHVRRAMNWVMDRNALRKAWGGAVVRRRSPSTSSRLDGAAREAERTTTRSRRRATAGSVAKAKAEMAKSKYANSSGVCTDKAVQGRAADHRRREPRTS